MQRKKDARWQTLHAEKELCAREVTAQGRVCMQIKKEPCARRRGKWPDAWLLREKVGAPDHKQTKKNAKWPVIKKGAARQKGRRQTCDRSKRCCATKKKLQVTDLRGQAGQTPVQPVHQGSSTGFNPGAPGKIWSKAAELKFSCKVQLASSAELESSAGQASWAQKKSLH
jgi:hypothetical protein